jgi:hypothetical protein
MQAKGRNRSHHCVHCYMLGTQYLMSLVWTFCSALSASSSVCLPQTFTTNLLNSTLNSLLLSLHFSFSAPPLFSVCTCLLFTSLLFSSPIMIVLLGFTNAHKGCIPAIILLFLYFLFVILTPLFLVRLSSSAFFLFLHFFLL